VYNIVHINKQYVIIIYFVLISSMLLNVLGFFFETFSATDVIQLCAVYDHGPKAVDQERTLNCFSIMPSSFTTFQLSLSCLFFPPESYRLACLY